MTKRISEQELAERISRLPREISPSRDPWPDIQARISRPAEPRQRRGIAAVRGWRAVAAAALVAVAAGWLLGLPETQLQSPSMAEAVVPGQAVYPAVLASSEAEYLAAFREFIPVGRTREKLPDQALEQIESGWMELVDAENALASALESDPGDPFLNDRMLELRARQLGFLRQLATLELSNRRMTI
ncbi:MAG: hypothetical protein HKP03_02065 [Xanthomonadales bacterium]|nr:hypothetical protein [Xanthomonadales bacterium]